MSAKRFGRFQKATTLLPLALLSTAVTASFAGVGTTSAVAGQQRPATLPDGTTVPTDAIEAPASISTPGVISPGLDLRNPSRAVSSASTSGIPAAALAAYQRAETVINAADRSCRLPWQLVAAVGRVESDHGRAGGNTLNDDGLATPGIFGIPLNGKNGTLAIRDTDAGQYDADARWDRAVGPMQFIPSTWSVVGVDGDNDGTRNPQDIDDAALSSAVYLCSGKDDLSTEAGQRAAVFRYNHSQEYVDLVLAFMAAYMSGDFTAVPNGVSSAGYFAPVTEPRGPQGQGGDGNGTNDSGVRGGGGGGGAGGGDNTPPPTTNEPDSQPVPDEPIENPDGDSGPLPDPDLPPVDEPTVDEPVEDTLTEAEATAQCVADDVVDDPLTPENELTQCVNNLLN